MTRKKPPIDRENAEDAGPPAMPTAENQPGYLFDPGPGVTTLDVLEVALMFVIQLTNSAVNVAPGALRLQLMSAERVAQLSPEAQRWMKSISLGNNPTTGE